MSQSDFAQFLKVAPQQLQKYESGANRIPAKRLYMAALALRCRPGDFLEGLPSDGEAVMANQGDPWTPEELTGLVPELSMLPRVSPPVRQAIASLIRASAVGVNRPERPRPARSAQPRSKSNRKDPGAGTEGSCARVRGLAIAF